MDFIRKARPDRVVAAASLAALLSAGAAGAQTTTGRSFADSVRARSDRAAGVMTLFAFSDTWIGKVDPPAGKRAVAAMIHIGFALPDVIEPLENR